ncbi:MAG: TetR/AcrR family transcriptional regulator [Proteobacteria bacterium]|nr:TetR/AcrR family transcriptional regulator [Pseudomonadota bacterium]
MGDATETQRKLIEVAIELFATNGFKGTSIRDIARAAGMTISSIYYYFESKYGLLLAILKHLSEGLENELNRISQAELGPLERFKLLVSTHLNQIAAQKDSAKLFFLDEEELSPAANEINKQFQIKILQIYKSALRDLAEAGYIDTPKNLTVSAFNVLGVIQWHLRWYRPEGPLPFEAIKDEAVRFMLFGLLANPSPADL